MNNIYILSPKYQLVDTDCNPTEFQIVISHLNRLNIAEHLYETIFIEIECKLRQQIVPNFWKYFHEDAEHSNEKGFYQFQYAVYELQKDYQKFQNIIERLKQFRQLCNFRKPQNQIQNEIDVFNDMLKVALLSQLPANFNNIVYSFYKISFKVFVNSHQEDTGKS